MQKLHVPFNIALLYLTPDKLKNVKQIKVLDIFDGATTNFHPDGLFSTTIFGSVGDERRSLMFGYIDIKATIFHPLIFIALTKLKRLYGEIMAGKTWALWDDGAKDFIKGKPSDGARTGYAFFLEHWKDIVFEGSDSATLVKSGFTGEVTNQGEEEIQTKEISNIRAEYIKLVNKNKEISLTNNIVVMPAGLRDMEIDELGRKSEDEINKFYRQFIAISNVIVDSSLTTNPEVIDKPRYDMQLKFVELYEMIEAMIKGKKKLFLGKVASRRIFNGTRNVITAMNTAVTVLGKKGTPGVNSTIIGLYQYLQASLPVSVAQVSKFLEPMFPDVNMPAVLVDPKTLRPRDVFLHVRYYDKWATKEGIEKVISSFKEEDVRNQPLLIDGYYLGLLYLGPDGTFKVFNDISQLPASRSKDHVRPLTLTDLLYLSVYQHSNKYPIYVTRYPIAGVGSIYPSNVHLRTTVTFEERKMLDDQWLDAGEHVIAYEFPIQGSAFVNSLVPHTSKLARLTADFDGDTCSGNIAYSDEAISNKDNYFKTKRAYIGPDGKLLYSCAVDTVELVLHNLTGEPVITKVGNENLSLLDALEHYREEDHWTFSHWGVEYRINDVFDMIHHKKPETVKMNDIEWNVKEKTELDSDRLVKADPKFPLIGIREKGKIYILDGNHRLRKLHDQGATTAKVVFIDQDILDIARVSD